MNEIQSLDLGGVSAVFRDAVILFGTTRQKLRNAVDQKQVMAHLTREGGWSAPYGVMVALSASIAVLGLLLSSPAVIIGAMLISPLMNPIMLLGFSLTTLDRHLVVRSLIAIGFGSMLAVGLSALIVWLSPLKSMTPEILARTHPNLFDLLVAIFSGLAGTYAVTHQKGETLVGVAIATALMPPLAVVGYAIATVNWTVLEGAGALFMTNLLAIGLMGSLVAKIFGFGHESSTSATMWQAAVVIGIFVVLSIPLGISLAQIAKEALESTRIRSTLNDYFSSGPDHIYGITVSHPDDQPVSVEALVLVQRPRPQLEHELQLRLRAVLHSQVRLTLSQIPSRPNESADEQAIAELKRQLDQERRAIEVPKPAPDMAALAASSLGLPLSEISVDRDASRMTLHIDDMSQLDLRTFRERVSLFQTQNPSWNIVMKISSKAKAAIHFNRGSAALDGSAMELISDVSWLFRLAGIQSAEVVGFSDTDGRSFTANRNIARDRATKVAGVLEEEGLTVKTRVEYPVPEQRRVERETGQAQFRIARIVGQD